MNNRLKAIYHPNKIYDFFSKIIQNNNKYLTNWIRPSISNQKNPLIESFYHLQDISSFLRNVS